MNPISLEQLTVDEAGPLELVTIAGALGCQHVSLFLRTPERPPQWYPLVTDAAFRRELGRRMADCGVTPYTVEFFPLSPRAQPDTYRPAFECAAELGAKRMSVLVSDTDEERRLANFSQLCDRAQEFAMGVNVEFVAITQLPSLRDAVRLVTRSARPNAGIMVDTLHLIRSGSTVAELAAIDPRLIGGAQFSDGPLTMAPDKQLFEAISERMLPGDGEFPLREFVAAMPPDVPIGVEVPLKSLKDKGVGPMERARLAVEASRRIIAEARAAQPVEK
ncbi:MAG TPA: TIM barrel protein [Candidatus Binataceae bacterium]|nr:TIM barrel protein [Candidatus Binataceae bacterium]